MDGNVKDLFFITQSDKDFSNGKQWYLHVNKWQLKIHYNTCIKRFQN